MRIGIGNRHGHGHSDRHLFRGRNTNRNRNTIGAMGLWAETPAFKVVTNLTVSTRYLYLLYGAWSTEYQVLSSDLPNVYMYIPREGAILGR